MPRLPSKPVIYDNVGLLYEKDVGSTFLLIPHQRPSHCPSRQDKQPVSPRFMVIINSRLPFTPDAGE